MDKEVNSKYSGIPMTEEGLKRFQQTWKDMEDCFKYLEERNEKGNKRTS